MNTTTHKVLLSLFLLCCLQSTHAQTCPNPIPSNAPQVAGYPAVPTAPKITPVVPLEDSNFKYWFVDNDFKTLDSYSVNSVGNQITVTAYITLLGAFPNQPLRCFPATMPALTEGVYFLTVKGYLRYGSGQYFTDPYVESNGPFEVKAAEKVPLSHWPTALLSALILSIVILSKKQNTVTNRK
jgi:hypothetical protein